MCSGRLTALRFVLRLIFQSLRAKAGISKLPLDEARAAPQRHAQYWSSSVAATGWSSSEKKIARRVFDAALGRELAEVMVEFKARAVAVSSPDEMWPLEEFLSRRRREIEAKYDYHYSQLDIVFGRLLRERRIEERDLEGISEEKISTIRRIASL